MGVFIFKIAWKFTFAEGTFSLIHVPWLYFIVQNYPPVSYRCKSETVANSQHSICGARNNFVGYLRLRSLEENPEREVCMEEVYWAALSGANLQGSEGNWFGLRGELECDAVTTEALGETVGISEARMTLQRYPEMKQVVSVPWHQPVVRYSLS